MNRKYLDDIGITKRPDTNFGNNDKDKREPRWEEQREVYGFDDRETWCLCDAFCMWLYERLMMYKEKASEVINLEYHKFTWKETEYTQLELINLLINKIKDILNIDNSWDEGYEASLQEIGEIWSLILPAMWW